MSLSLINHLLQSYGYYAVFVFIALESLGIPLPGETTLIAAAIYAGSTGHLNIVVVFLVAAAAAVLGDNAGYWIGRSGGRRLLNRYGRFVRLDATKMKIGLYLFARHGRKVVFFGRFVTVLRTYVAFLAGLNTMHWRRFTASNAAGGLAWSAAYAFGAFSLGTAATSVGQTITLVGLGISTVLTAAGIVLARRWMRRLEQRAQAAYPDPDPEQAGAGRADTRPQRSRRTIDAPAGIRRIHGYRCSDGAAAGEARRSGDSCRAAQGAARGGR